LAVSGSLFKFVYKETNGRLAAPSWLVETRSQDGFPQVRCPIAIEPHQSDENYKTNGRQFGNAKFHEPSGTALFYQKAVVGVEIINPPNV
jgi:hypothetical protein